MRQGITRQAWHISGMSGACTLSSRSVLAERKTLTGKGWQPVGRILTRETYRYALIAAICTLRRASVPIIPMAFDAVTVRAAVAMKVLLRVTHRYTQTVHLCRDTEQVGREVTRRLRGGHEESEDACARGAAGITFGCQGIVTLPNLCMSLASLQSLHVSRGHQ